MEMESTNDIPLRSVSQVSSFSAVSRETPSHEPITNNMYHLHEGGTPAYEATNEDELPPYQRTNPVHYSSSTPLRRSTFFLVPIAIYAAMAIYSWVILCLLSRAGDVVVNQHDTKVNHYRAARVLRVITSVATIPVISLVCAWAAAVYVQNQRDAHSLSLRQVMTLADRGWMDPRIWFRLVFYPSGLKRYGSALLVLAIFMHLSGAITYPIQSLFLSHRLAYVQRLNRWGDRAEYPNTQFILSIPRLIRYGFSGSSIFALRNELLTPGLNGGQSQLWGNTDVLSEINSTTNWFAPLSSNFSTGLFSDQYVPRVNSSASIRNMTAGEFPSDCSKTGDWFYAYYTYPKSRMNLTVEVCVPINTTESPWKSIDGRQDFSEVLYVNPTTKVTRTYGGFNATPFVVTMNTTAGAFRLPSVRTNQIPGPLEANSSLCLSYSCRKGSYRRNYLEPAVPGPLTLIALALFGPGSFAETEQNATYTTFDFGNDTEWKQYFDRISARYPIPLANLGVGADDYSGLAIERWIAALTYSQNFAVTTSAFTQASFLATKALFDPHPNGDHRVEYSPSALEQIDLPSMPHGALIAGSLLLALYIIPLLGLALYAAAAPRWTNTLDAFTMLRMGAAFGQEHLPLLVGKNMRKIQVLDDLPGVVRDVSGPDDKIRQLALGVGGGPLQTEKRYMAYPGNHYLP